MRPWIKRTLFGLFGASLLVGGLSACASRHEGRWAMTAENQARFREKMIDRVSSRLELNADQKQRLGTLADKLQEQRAALVGKTTDPRAEVRAMVAGDKFDRARAQSLINDKAAALGSKSPEVVAAMGDFYDSLNATQQARVRELMERRHGWWRS